MLVLWLATGVITKTAVEQRGKGGSGKGWLLRGEFDYRDEDEPSDAVTVKDIRQATAKLRPTPAPALAPTPIAAEVVEAVPAKPVAVLFERKPEKASTPTPAASAPITLTPETKDALGMKPIERTYDLELLLLVAA
jgi:hypothetical protein